jgi:hypothetical protein
MPVQTKIQIRRGTTAEWLASMDALSQGELGYDLSLKKFKVGDGTSLWNGLSWATIIGSDLVSSSGINISYAAGSGVATVSVTGLTSSYLSDFSSAVSGLLPVKSIVAGNNITVTPSGDNGFVISSPVNENTVKDIVGSTITGVSGIAFNYNSTAKTATISLSDPTIQSTDITDFNSAVSGLLGVKSLIQGTGIGISNNGGDQTISITGIPASLITNFDSGVNDLIEDAVSTSIVGGSGVGIVYNSGNNTLTISSSLTAGSGISLNHSSGNYTIALSDPTIQLAEITDLTANARDFLLTPSSDNLAALVSNETGTGSLVFANNPTMSGVTINGNLTVSGSGLVASNINDFNTAVRTNRLDQMAVPTGDVSFNSVKITSLADPVSAQDAATKAYVDAARMGLDVKQSARVATTVNITLSGTQTIDGVAVVAGDRVLVKNQTTGSQNGIYDVAVGSWSRASDSDSNAKVTTGLFTFVSEGTLNADSGWVLTTNDAITLGTTSLAFAQFSGAGQITTGAGLTKNGNTIDAVGTAGRIVVNADNIDLDTVSQTDGSGSAGTTFVQSVTRDSYGRVTGVTTASVQDATTSAKGVASFDSGDFSVSSGSVSIKASGVDNSQLVNSSFTIGSTSVSLGSTTTAVSGLTSVSSTSFVGDLSGTATNANNVEVDLSTSNVNNLLFVNGTDGNLKPSVNNNLRFNASSNELIGSSNTTPATVLKYFIIDGGTP